MLVKLQALCLRTVPAVRILKPEDSKEHQTDRTLEIDLLGALDWGSGPSTSAALASAYYASSP